MSFTNDVVKAVPVTGHKPPTLTKSKCLIACISTAQKDGCKDFGPWKQVDQGNVSSKKGTTVTKTLFDKKEWYLGPKKGRNSWFGGHVYDDGSMVQWIYGEANKNLAIKYEHTDHSVIYWQKGQEQCYAPHGTFANFGTLRSVAVLESP